MCLLCVRDIIYLNLDSVDALVPSPQYVKTMTRAWLIWLLYVYAVVGGRGRLVGNHHVFQYHRKVWSSKILNPQHTALASARIDVMVKRK